jgi:hypothetical protein
VNALNSLLIAVGAVLLYLATIAYRQPRVADRVAYWHHSLTGLDETPDRVYAQVYQALKEGLRLRGVSLSGMGFGPSLLFETHSVFSHRPLYFCARYQHLTYYFYVSQVPTGLFVSTSLYSKFVKGAGEKKFSTIAAHRYFQKQTMFQFDATLMFQETVHALVLEVLDRYIGEENLKPLEEYERRPVYHAFYQSYVPAPPTPIFTVLPGAVLPGTILPGTVQAGTHGASFSNALHPSSFNHGPVVSGPMPQGVPRSPEMPNGIPQSTNGQPYSDTSQGGHAYDLTGNTRAGHVDTGHTDLDNDYADNLAPDDLSDGGVASIPMPPGPITRSHGSDSYGDGNHGGDSHGGEGAVNAGFANEGYGPSGVPDGSSVNPSAGRNLPL